jgi:hypothetical protein
VARRPGPPERPRRAAGPGVAALAGRLGESAVYFISSSQAQILRARLLSITRNHDFASTSRDSDSRDLDSDLRIVAHQDCCNGGRSHAARIYQPLSHETGDDCLHDSEWIRNYLNQVVSTIRNLDI